MKRAYICALGQRRCAPLRLPASLSPPCRTSPPGGRTDRSPSPIVVPRPRILAVYTCVRWTDTPRARALPLPSQPRRQSTHNPASEPELAEPARRPESAPDEDVDVDGGARASRTRAPSLGAADPHACARVWDSGCGVRCEVCVRVGVLWAWVCFCFRAGWRMGA